MSRSDNPSGAQHWRVLGQDPSILVDARLQAHWAAQIVAAAANALLERRDDDSQSNLGWLPEHGALASHDVSLDAFAKTRAALRLADMTLLLLDDSDESHRELPLAGLTLAQAMRDFGKVVGADLELRDYEMPEHPVADGATFTPAGAAHRELARWYGNAAWLLEQLRAEHAEASPARLWPHHFDIAFLIQLSADTSVGVGFLAGDSSYAQPYWYVSPWPYPDSKPSAPLAGGGHWRTEGFTAAILTAERLLEEATADGQAARAEAFARSALQALL